MKEKKCSAARLRRMLAQAERGAAAVTAFAPEEPAALQIAAARPGTVLRSVEAVTARLERPRRQVPETEAEPMPEGLPAPA